MKVLLNILLFSYGNLNAKEQFLKIENIEILDNVLNYFTYENLKNIIYLTILD